MIRTVRPRNPLGDLIARFGSEEIAALDQGRPVAFSFADMLAYHGSGSPGGVAHAFKVLQRALPLLGAGGSVERREIAIRTAFGGPGARDGFELVTRAVTAERYIVDPTLARPERGLARERFVFRLQYRGAVATLHVRAGFVTDEFIELARKEERTGAEDADLERLKLEMAERVMSGSAIEVYDVSGPD